eukprot:TRINITY_DN6471_c0_g1_i2.p1 TRINITY_DN6471_c0_g1~~TRINITY_DN6471_c0_g1_i2.p1  ORF type:complete len:185 (-),score=40.67 TRINITY_DN6471_c0_g1_i2:123-677(-)
MAAKLAPVFALLLVAGNTLFVFPAAAAVVIRPKLAELLQEERQQQEAAIERLPLEAGEDVAVAPAAFPPETSLDAPVASAAAENLRSEVASMHIAGTEVEAGVGAKAARDALSQRALVLGLTARTQSSAALVATLRCLAGFALLALAVCVATTCADRPGGKLLPAGLVFRPQQPRQKVLPCVVR